MLINTNIISVLAGVEPDLTQPKLNKRLHRSKQNHGCLFIRIMVDMTYKLHLMTYTIRKAKGPSPNLEGAPWEDSRGKTKTT